MFKSFFHIILAINFATATVGITLDKHFCGELLQKISLQGEKKTCCDMEREAAEDNGCCHNESEALGVKDTFQKVQFQFNFPTVSVVAINTTHLLPIDLFPVNAAFAVHFSKYKPPLLKRDITVQFQTFLI